MTDMIESDVSTAKHPVLKRVVFFASGLILLYFGIQLVRYHYFLVTFPYPLEFREGAVLFTTNVLLEGKNPYALQNMPIAMNVYGINYHWIVYPFAKLWGATFVVHRTVSAVFILLALLLFFMILRRHNIGKLYSLAAALVLYASLLYRYTPLARPDGVGFFLFLIGIYIVYLARFSTASLVISVVLGVAAFYTKPYFVLSIPYVAVYLFLFVSKQKAILYGILSFVLLAFTALAVNAIYETYFLNTFINHINAATDDRDYLGMQLALFWNYNAGIMLGFLVFAFLAVVDRLGGNPGTNPGVATTLKVPTGRMSIWDIQKPLLGYDFPLSLYCLILSFGIFYFKLGRHIGNIMTYAYQLITPFLLIYAFSLFNLPLKKLRLAKVIGDYSYVLLLPCILLSLFLLYSSASYLKDSRKWLGLEGWMAVEEILLAHEEVLNSAVLASLLVEQDKTVYDNGQTEYFQYSQYSYDWLAGVLPSNSEISMQWNRYENSMIQIVEEQGFDAVIIDTLISRPYYASLQEHYFLKDTIELCMFHAVQCVQLEIWEPK